MSKILLKFVALAFLVFICTGFLSNVFSETKRGNDVWNDFYDIPQNSLDLIFLGSSLSYSNFNPLVFNGYMRVGSYNTGTALQNIKQSYYNLEEILEYQSPKLIVLEAYSLDVPDKSEEDRLGFKFENLDSQKFSFRKLRAINNQFSTLQNKINALSPLIRNHNNWSDFDFIQENLSHSSSEDRFLGYKLVKVGSYKKPTKELVENLPSKHFFSEENQEYFKKLVKLCNENSIQLVVVRAPVLLYKYNTRYYDQVYKNTEAICNKFKIKYIDYNQKFNLLKLEESYFADEKHLNYKGATIISELLAKQLSTIKIENNKTRTQFQEPEDYVYSDSYKHLGQTIFKGEHFIDDSTVINEVKLLKLNDDEYSVIVKMENGLNFDKISNYSFGYYFYPIDSQVSLLETDKDLKRKYTSIGGNGVPMFFKKNYYVTLRSYKTKINKYKKVKIQLYNKQVYGKSLIIENVLFEL